MTRTKLDELAHRHDCHCDDKIINTGAVYLRSTGWLICTICDGVQPIRKPITWSKDNDSHTTTP